MSKTVILDSSALIAEINLADSLHEKVQPVNEFIAKTNRHVILCPTACAINIDPIRRKRASRFMD